MAQEPFVVQVRLRDFYAVELSCSMVRIITLPCRLLWLSRRLWPALYLQAVLPDF